MRCPNCSAENAITNAFCEACGTPLGPTCAACGHTNRPNSRFCGNCTARLLSFTPTARSSEQLLRSLSASGGEHKRLTVMFADVRNSTALIDSLDPEEAVRRMQPVIEIMREAVDRYEGVVNRVQGDGVMALFGAPRPHEDHPVRACLAALAMQDAVARLGDPDLKIRVGLHTGNVVVQVVESSLYQTYDAAGATVHLASRVEQMAEGGDILLTGDTYTGARQFVQTKSIGWQSLRGLLAPVEVFRLVGVKHAPASELFRSRSHLSPLTGRDEQLAVLESELAHTANGDGRIVAVVGEAGIGKSRLCFEFAEACRRRGIHVYEARVLAHGRATPFQPILELLRDYFQIKPTEPPDEARCRITKNVINLPCADEALPFLLDFLGLADSAVTLPKVDSAMRKMRLTDFVREIARSGPRGQTTVVLVTDLHWIDPGSEEFIEALADSVVGTTTMLLLNFRPGYTAPWMQRSHYRQISLAQLGAKQADNLLKTLLGGDPSLALVTRNIAERARGNPFFIEELIRSLVERGDFEGTRGAYRRKGGIDTIPMPATIQAVLSARIDRLDDLAKRTLQSAAVVGREIPLPILERIVDMRPTDFATALSQLRRAELLDELPSHENRLHAFSHPLVQEVAYRSLLNSQRRKIHAAVARAMKAEFKDRAQERVSLIAYHLEQAGEMIEAAQAYMRAAIWVGTHDASQALKSWKKVHELLAPQTPSQSTDFLRMMACLQIMNFGWREGILPKEAEDYFNEAKQLALGAENFRANAWIHATYARILASRGSADEYISRIQEAEAFAGQSKDASLQATLKGMLCHALRLAGRMTDALIVNTEAMNRTQEIGEWDHQMLGFDVERWLTVMRGQILVYLGRFDEARACLDRSLQTNVEQVDDIHYLATVAYVDLAWAQADPCLAQHHAERGFRMAVRGGSPYVRVHAQACRGLSHVIAGRFDAAVDDFREALAFARRKKAGLEIEARILADQANAHRLKGDLDRAMDTATEAIDVASARGARVPECLARIVIAQVLLASGQDAYRIADEVRKAQVLMQQTGAIIYQPLMESLIARLANNDQPLPGPRQD